MASPSAPSTLQGVILCFLALLVYGLQKPVISPFQFIPSKPSAGSQVKTYCDVIEGDHPISITWLHNGKRIDKSAGNEDIKAMDETSTMLRIKDVDIANIGNYTCVATNSEGFDSHTVELKFEGPPKWKQGLPSNLDVLAGQTAIFNCASTGYPIPSVFWFLENS